VLDLIKDALKARVALAERHVREGEQHVMCQLARVQALAAKGYETSDAEQTLRQFRQAHVICIADRDRLKLELAASDAADRNNVI